MNNPGLQPQQRPFNYAALDANSLEGLAVLAEERMRVADIQATSISEHMREQEQILAGLAARYESDLQWFLGYIAFLGYVPPRFQALYNHLQQVQAQVAQMQQAQQMQQVQLPPPVPQAAVPQAVMGQFPNYPPGYAAPTPPSAPMLQPGQAPPQRVVVGPAPSPYPQTAPAQPPVVMGPAGSPYPGAPQPVTPPAVLMGAPSGPYADQSQGPAAVVAQAPQSPYPQAPAPKPPVVQHTTAPGYPRGMAPHPQGGSILPDGRRTHLIPNGQGGWKPDPNFVDEQGRMPVSEITPEMREAWAQDQKREVHLFEPGQEGHVPAGGGNIIVKRPGAINGQPSQNEVVVVDEPPTPPPSPVSNS